MLRLQTQLLRPGNSPDTKREGGVETLVRNAVDVVVRDTGSDHMKRRRPFVVERGNAVVTAMVVLVVVGTKR
jgi:hypothetical protein